MSATIAFIAHDSQKNNLIEFVRTHGIVLSRYRLIATGNTGQRLQESTDLTFHCYASGALGGVVQVASEVVEGKVCAVFCWVDPFALDSELPGIQALLQICQRYEVAFATHGATSRFLIEGLARSRVAHLIFNPVAGQGNADEELVLIQNLLDPYFDLQVHSTTVEVDAEILTQKALLAQADLVIASGGDGTVSAVAGQLIKSNVPLGVIPRGTANAFCAALGITSAIMQIRTACRIIAEGHTRVVDAAYCNGMPMILLAGIGFEAETVERADRELKNQWGALAYLMAGWQQLNEQELFEANIEINEQIYPFEAAAITVANAAPPTSFLAQGMGDVPFDDGLLDVTIATAETKLQAVTSMMSALGAALLKTQPGHPQVHHMRTHQLKISTNPPQKIVLDGEIVGMTPVEIECVPQGLTVFVPKE